MSENDRENLKLLRDGEARSVTHRTWRRVLVAALVIVAVAVAVVAYLLVRLFGA